MYVCVQASVDWLGDSPVRRPLPSRPLVWRRDAAVRVSGMCLACWRRAVTRSAAQRDTVGGGGGGAAASDGSAPQLSLEVCPMKGRGADRRAAVFDSATGAYRRPFECHAVRTAIAAALCREPPIPRASP